MGAVRPAAPDTGEINCPDWAPDAAGAEAEKEAAGAADIAFGAPPSAKTGGLMVTRAVSSVAISGVILFNIIMIS
jgi:hypothetical protein